MDPSLIFSDLTASLPSLPQHLSEAAKHVFGYKFNRLSFSITILPLREANIKQS